MNENSAPIAPLEMWGGIECTVNRVEDRYLDQIAASGHAWRESDLDRIAALGIRTLRYPALWEWAQNADVPGFDWTWADDRLARLRQLHVRPIIGLVHHGSGPRYTNLIDPMFVDGLANYARRFAERFPWVDMYTPINEPLTTARFSAMYGHWYPHRRDAQSFVRALVNQCRAVVLSMRAIREVRPDAKLIQTEDLGKSHSTATMQYQADFENERRWLSFDLLCGRVNGSHPLASYLRYVGINEEEWLWFLDNPCPPDVVGINHYLTSERFLDERVDRYPPHTHGGNDRHRYADVEAVRVCDHLTGPARLLRETWDRYQLPIAVTEVHLGCTREEQMRWLAEVWHAAHSVRNDGVDVKAITAWAMLGSYDWDSLVTQARGHYESGVFDLRGQQPRPTALARLVEKIADGEAPSHPVLDGAGWWHRPPRLCYECAPSRDQPAQSLSFVPAAQQRPILILGAGGILGSAFPRVCGARGLAYKNISRKELNFTSRKEVRLAIEQAKPWAVVHVAGYFKIDEAELQSELCFRENSKVPALLADVCSNLGIKLVTFSSDLVFDGSTYSPYRESDAANPLSVYGRSRAESERRVLAREPGSLVIRSGAFFGPWDASNFLAATRAALEHNPTVCAADDLYVSPTYVPDFVNACLDLLIDDESGVWHVANSGAVTWADLARDVARHVGRKESDVIGCAAQTFGWRAPRPSYSVLRSERGVMLPTLEHALARYFAESSRPC